MAGYHLEHYGASDIGLTRQNNEDVWAELPELAFFALADGMGGHKAGEVAATEAVVSLCQSVREALSHETFDAEQARAVLTRAFSDANRWVFHLSEREEALHGMGTTLCCMMLCGSSLVYAHVGDSRVYRYRDGLEQLSHDHSLRGELLARGELEEESAFHYPFKNVITRAIGTNASVEIDSAITDVRPGDVYFLCSDGLTDYVPSSEVAACIEGGSSVKQSVTALIHAAKAKGGNDNITIVMIKIFP
jgi:protein phosphatase